MWPDRDRTEMTCIACGTEVERSRAREYDKHGDRWDRKDKTFEYLCKPCHRDLTHQPRTGLEATLTTLDAGSVSRAEFLEAYQQAVEDAAEQDGTETGSEQ